jgi:hypothetical protein
MEDNSCRVISYKFNIDKLPDFTQIEEDINNICNTYNNTYNNIIGTKERLNKEDFFDMENSVRMNLDKSSTLYHILDSDGKIQLASNIVEFVKKRRNSIYKCIKSRPENNTFLLEEQERLNNLDLMDYNIDNIKNICNAINWGLNNRYDCSIIENKEYKLHKKTISSNESKYNLQSVFGFGNEIEPYRNCNRLFYGKLISGSDNNCSKYVEWNILLNKYYTLSRYYTKAKFRRFIMPKYYCSPFRRFPPAGTNQNTKIPELTLPDSKLYIAKIKFGPYNFTVYKNTMKITPITGIYKMDYILYDDKMNMIQYPLLRSNITITYTEFRDVLIYLNLPVFRSTFNKNVLFFPNYDEHSILIDIHNKYSDSKIDIDNRKPLYVYAWFNNKDAMKEVNEYCKLYEEDNSSIEPVDYRWFEVTFNEGRTKKYIFLLLDTISEYIDNYKESKFLFSETYKKWFIYNDIIKEHALLALNKQCKLKLIYVDIRMAKRYDDIRKKYIKYKTKYIILKNQYV